MASGIMGGQPDSHAQGLPEEAHTGADVDAPQGAESQGPTAAPALRRTCCLGDLILGPEAPNWARLLVLDHLDPGSRLALYRTCTAARDLMLVTAKKATFTVEVNEPDDMARLRQVRSSLQTRGKLRTKLMLKVSDSSMLLFAVAALEAGTTWLDELHVRIPQAEEPLYSNIIAAAAWCCPNLRALYLQKAPRELPSPSLFPKLKELCIVNDGSEAAAPLFRLAAPYINQLTDLRLYPRRYGWVQPTPSHLPALLFTPSNVAAHLTTLHLPATLNDRLLGLLLECALALEVLNVARIQLETDTHAQVQVQWRELWTHDLFLSSLARLPVAPSLEIWFNPKKRDTAPPFKPWGHPTVWCDIVGGEVPPAACLRKVWIVSDDMTLQVDEDVSAEDQPAALRACLDLLMQGNWRQTSAAGPSSITLAFWTMSAELMLELPRLPRFDSLGFDSPVWLPGPLLYTTMLHLVPDSVHEVRIHATGLTSEQLERMCLGAPAGRPAELRIKVADKPDQVQAIQLKMQQGGYPNVTVTNWEE